MLGVMETPFNHFFTDRIYPGTLDVITRGPLAAHLMAYAQQLHDQGYAVSSGQSQLRMLGHFNAWLRSEGLAAQQIDSSTLERYVRCRRRSGKLQKGDEAALAHLWRILRPGEVGTPPSPPCSGQRFLFQFQNYFLPYLWLPTSTITSSPPAAHALLR